MSEIRESNIALYLIDPDIRSSVKAYLEPWMFQKELFRSYLGEISKDDFDDRELDRSVIKMGIEAGPKKYQEGDLKGILALILILLK